MTELAFHPVFDRRPDDSYIEQWREHIKETGTPETFDYVSMVRPFDMEGATLMSGYIDVPLHKREDEAMVPCPLCRPSSPKFKIGRMAWFPSDKTVLFVGNDCAKRHMGSEFVVADKRFKKETAAKALAGAWSEIQTRAAELISFGITMLPVAFSLEKAKKQFRADAPEFSNFMRNEFFVKGGRIESVEDTGMRDNRGKRISQTRQIGTLVGSDFLLSFNSHQVIRSAISTLEEVKASDFPEWSLDDPDTTRLDEALAKGNRAVKAVHSLRDARTHLHEARLFIHENNVALFQRWADMKESPFANLNFRWKGSWLFLNVSAYFGSENLGFQVGTDVFAALPNLNTTKFDLPGYQFVSRIKGQI